MWKFQNSNKEVKIGLRYKMVSAKVLENGYIHIPKEVISQLENLTDIPELHGNCVLVVDLVGILIPPKTWAKII